MNKEEQLEKVCKLMKVDIGDLPAFPKKDTDLILLVVLIGLKKNFISKEEVKKNKKEIVDSTTNFFNSGYNIAKQKIKKDLLKIADKGELEELRREVIKYFKNK